MTSKNKKSKVLVSGLVPETQPITETVEVDGKMITVHEGSFVMALKKETLRKKMFNVCEAKKYDDEEQTVLIMFYPPMVACSSCETEMFTYEEFLGLKETEIDKWYRAVNKLNPHWFPKAELLEEELNNEHIKELANKNNKGILKDKSENSNSFSNDGISKIENQSNKETQLKVNKVKEIKNSFRKGLTNNKLS